MKIKRKKRKWNPNEKSGIANEAIPVMATIIINIGLTILALTAACPKTNAPTIPMVGPIGDGTLKPASLINSKDISIIIISKITGNGTVSLASNIEYKSSVGSISWWKLVTATYSPGSNKVIMLDKNLRDFKKFAKYGFKLVSSGEDMKSINVAGIIRE